MPTAKAVLAGGAGIVAGLACAAWCPGQRTAAGGAAGGAVGGSAAAGDEWAAFKQMYREGRER